MMKQTFSNTFNNLLELTTALLIKTIINITNTQVPCVNQCRHTVDIYCHIISYSNHRYECNTLDKCQWNYLYNCCATHIDIYHVMPDTLTLSAVQCHLLSTGICRKFGPLRTSLLSFYQLFWLRTYNGIVSAAGLSEDKQYLATSGNVVS